MKITEFFEARDDVRGILNETEKKLLAAIENDEITPLMTLREMGEVIGVTHPQTVSNALKALRKYLVDKT